MTVPPEELPAAIEPVKQAQGQAEQPSVVEGEARGQRRAERLAVGNDSHEKSRVRGYSKMIVPRLVELGPRLSSSQ